MVSDLRGLRARPADRPLAALALLRAGRSTRTPSGRCSASRYARSSSPRPGVAFGYWVLLPRAVHFLVNYDPAALPDPAASVLLLQLRGRPSSSGSCSSSRRRSSWSASSGSASSARDTLRRHRRMGYLVDGGDRACAARRRIPSRRSSSCCRCGCCSRARSGSPFSSSDASRKSRLPRLPWAADGQGSGQGEAAGEGEGRPAGEDARARPAAAQRRRQSEPGSLLRPAAAPSEVGVRRARGRLRVQFRPRGSRFRRQRRADRALHRPASAAAAAPPSRRLRTRSRRIPRRATRTSPSRTRRRATSRTRSKRSRAIS